MAVPFKDFFTLFNVSLEKKDKDTETNGMKDHHGPLFSEVKMNNEKGLQNNPDSVPQKPKHIKVIPIHGGTPSGSLWFPGSASKSA